MATLDEACGTPASLVCEAVFDATDSEWTAKAADWAVDIPLRILLIVLGAMFVHRLLRRIINRFVDRLVRERETSAEASRVPILDSLGNRASAGLEMLAQRSERSRQRAQTLGALLRSVAGAVILIVAGLLVLGELSINLAPLLAGAGIAGIAIGFGAQTIVRDLLAGIFMVVEDQYGVGDIVDVGEVTGTVERVSWRTTWLRDVEGALWVVPNGEIHRVANKSQLWSRTVLDIDVAYDSDIDAAMAVIKRVADEVYAEQPPNARILEEPEVWGVEAFGPNTVTLRLVVKTHPGQQWSTAREIRRRLKAAFDAEGIGIPVPQRMHVSAPPTPGSDASPSPADGGTGE